MQEGFVDKVNSVPTHIFTWGQWISPYEESKKELIIVITGNPGLPGFYTTFCSTLYNELDNKIPVWAIGHAGHDKPADNLELFMPPLEGNENLYNLEGQLNHKIEFIKRYIPEDVKIHLIGHSVGCKVAMDLLKHEEIGSRIHQCYFLFATIEKMAETSNGFWLYKVFNKIFFLLQFLYYAFSFLPLTLRTWIVYMYCLAAGHPKYFLGTIIKMSTPECLDRIWFMALDEMKSIRELDDETIRENMHRIKFYYGTTDGWVPVKYYHQLVSKFPGIDAELCERKIDHTFVIDHGHTMGRMVSEWVRRKKVQ